MVKKINTDWNQAAFAAWAQFLGVHSVYAKNLEAAKAVFRLAASGRRPEHQKVLAAAFSGLLGYPLPQVVSEFSVVFTTEKGSLTVQAGWPELSDLVALEFVTPVQEGLARNLARSSEAEVTGVTGSGVNMWMGEEGIEDE